MHFAPLEIDLERLHEPGDPLGEVVARAEPDPVRCPHLIGKRRVAQLAMQDGDDFLV